jgi:hypothetical protein
MGRAVGNSLPAVGVFPSGAGSHLAAPGAARPGGVNLEEVGVIGSVLLIGSCFGGLRGDPAVGRAATPVGASATAPRRPHACRHTAPPGREEYLGHRLRLSRAKRHKLGPDPDRKPPIGGRTPIPTAASGSVADLACGVASGLRCEDPLQRKRQRAPRCGRAVGGGGLLDKRDDPHRATTLGANQWVAILDLFGPMGPSSMAVGSSVTAG